MGRIVDGHLHIINYYLYGIDLKLIKVLCTFSLNGIFDPVYDKTTDTLQQSPPPHRANCCVLLISMHLFTACFKNNFFLFYCWMVLPLILSLIKLPAMRVRICYNQTQKTGNH